MNIIPNHLMASRLQNIIGSQPHAHTATQARELMSRLPRAPVDGHELYSAGAGEVDQAYVGTVYQAPSGQWSFRIDTPEGPHCAGGGFDTEDEAQDEMWNLLGELNHGEELENSAID